MSLHNILIQAIQHNFISYSNSLQVGGNVKSENAKVGMLIVSAGKASFSPCLLSLDETHPFFQKGAFNF